MLLLLRAGIYDVSPRADVFIDIDIVDTLRRTPPNNGRLVTVACRTVISLVSHQIVLLDLVSRDCEAVTLTPYIEIKAELNSQPPQARNF